MKYLEKKIYLIDGKPYWGEEIKPYWGEEIINTEAKNEKKKNKKNKKTYQKEII